MFALAPSAGFSGSGFVSGEVGNGHLAVGAGVVDGGALGPPERRPLTFRRALGVLRCGRALTPCGSQHSKCGRDWGLRSDRLPSHGATPQRAPASRGRDWSLRGLDRPLSNSRPSRRSSPQLPLNNRRRCFLGPADQCQECLSLFQRQAGYIEAGRERSFSECHRRQSWVQKRCGKRKWEAARRAFPRAGRSPSPCRTPAPKPPWRP